MPTGRICWLSNIPMSIESLKRTKLVNSWLQSRKKCVGKTKNYPCLLRNVDKTQEYDIRSWWEVQSRHAMLRGVMQSIWRSKGDAQEWSEKAFCPRHPSIKKNISIWESSFRVNKFSSQSVQYWWVILWKVKQVQYLCCFFWLSSSYSQYS